MHVCRHPDVKWSEGWSLDPVDKWPEDNTWTLDAGRTVELGFEGCQVCAVA